MVAAKDWVAVHRTIKNTFSLLISFNDISPEETIFSLVELTETIFIFTHYKWKSHLRLYNIYLNMCIFSMKVKLMSRAKIVKHKFTPCLIVSKTPCCYLTRFTHGGSSPRFSGYSNFCFLAFPTCER